MRLEAYHGSKLAATFEFGKPPTYHGTVGRRIRAAIEAWPEQRPALATAMSGVPTDWLQWAASVVYPALTVGMFVRWQG